MLFLIFPAAISWVCHVVLSGDPGKYRTLGIVSPELVDGMETCTSLNYTGCDDYARPFSCRFIDYLTNSSIHTVGRLYKIQLYNHILLSYKFMYYNKNNTIFQTTITNFNFSLHYLVLLHIRLHPPLSFSLTPLLRSPLSFFLSL